MSIASVGLFNDFRDALAVLSATIKRKKETPGIVVDTLSVKAALPEASK